MGLQISKNKRHLEKEGSSFFYLADTCWSAFTNIDEPSWEYYLQYRRRQGYNTLQINILQQWDASETVLDNHPFALDEDGNFNFYEIHDAYFEHAHKMCKRAKEYGFELALVVLWCNYVPGTWANKMMRHNTMPYECLEAYVNKVHQTFSSLDPIYVISGDTDLDEEISRSYYAKAGAILRERAPECLQTYHIRGRMVEIPDEIIDQLDFYMYQTGHSAKQKDLPMTYEMPAYFLENYPQKPLINAEPCYELIGYASRMYGRFHQFDIRRAAWQSLLSGASAGIAYGAGGIYSWHLYGKKFAPCIGEGFDMPHPWQTALHYPGAWDYGDIINIFEDNQIHDLIPRQDLLLNDTQEIRVAMAAGEREREKEHERKYERKREALILIYAPENTTIKLNVSINDIVRVKIIDLETRHAERGRVYLVDDFCCIEMHTFSQDVLYVVEMKK